MIQQAGENDIILIAGKGHEEFQEIAGEQHLFSDHREVINHIAQIDSSLIEKIFHHEMDDDFYATHLNMDSRKIKPFELFIALPSEKNDGEEYIEMALKRGAAAAICSHAYFKQHTALKNKLIPVDDRSQAMDKIASYKRLRSHAKVISITGSVGKTTTKELLKSAFLPQAKILATYGNYNNYLGVPISLAALSETHEIGIFEVGMNHSAEISPLSKIIQPDIAIITNIEAVHIANFNHLDEIALAKAEIFDGMQPGGIAILNSDNPYFESLSDIAKEKRLKICSFGESINADIRLLEIEYSADQTSAKVLIYGKEFPIRTSAPGKQLLNTKQSPIEEKF